MHIAEQFEFEFMKDRGPLPKKQTLQDFLPYGT